MIFSFWVEVKLVHNPGDIPVDSYKAFEVIWDNPVSTNIKDNFEQHCSYGCFTWFKCAVKSLQNFLSVTIRGNFFRPVIMGKIYKVLSDKLALSHTRITFVLLVLHKSF